MAVSGCSCCSTPVCQKADLLLLDEPTAGLDWSMRQQLVSLLARLKAHWSLLVVSHDASDLLSIADQCWTLNHGELNQVDPTTLKSPGEAQLISQG